jgi:putative membrane protein
MTYDFSKPQRQSVFGIIIMAGHTLQKMLKALAFPIIYAIVKTDKQYAIYLGLGIVLFFAIILLFGYLSYRRFTFYLDQQKQEFVINKGVFNRTQLTVQLSKIQQVNINQNLLQKIIGIYGLKIDTAGSDGQEVSIKAINENLANALRVHLLSRKDEFADAEIQHETASPIIEQEVPLLKISGFTLLKVGITSNYGSSFALLIAFLFPLYHNAKELLSLLDMDTSKVEDVLISLFSIFSLLIIVLGLLFVLLSINLIRTFVKYFEFTISKHRHSLLISAGLFAKRNTLLSPNKVQITTYSQNYFQKKMKLLNMNLKQATSGHSHKAKDLESSNLEIPGCNPTEREQSSLFQIGAF